MSTPLTDSINALTRYANEVTGASDTTLSDAVATLASGYGGSGSYPDTLSDFSGGNIQALISHSAEYINTGYYPKGCCEAVLYASKDTKYIKYENYFGTYFGTSSTRIGCQANVQSLTDVKFYVGSNTDTTLSNIMSTTPRLITCRALITQGDETATGPLLIFQGYYNGNHDNLSGYNFYGLKCYECGKLVKKYVPWLDDNGVPCIHELVDDEYFYNVGTGSFDYIDANGNTVTT